LETGLPAQNLELELTEGVLMEDAASATSVLLALKAMGIHLAIDDFGTGYSSLSYLKKFPIDALKIDQSFIHQNTTVSDKSSIVSAVIAMGRSLKLRVVAEGVETLDELMVLQGFQCDEAQGFYFSRPVAAELFADLLQKGAAGVFVH
jgi:EAL domain-containing protein (putative c-di-GMP-specific phosphodiesterase class I)